MHEDMSLRERLAALTDHREPAFELSDDPTLVAFSKLFAESELLALEASKRRGRSGAGSRNSGVPAGRCPSARDLSERGSAGR